MRHIQSIVELGGQHRRRSSQHGVGRGADKRRNEPAAANESKQTADGFLISEDRLSRTDDAAELGRQTRRRRHQGGTSDEIGVIFPSELCFNLLLPTVAGFHYWSKFL